MSLNPPAVTNSTLLEPSDEANQRLVDNVHPATWQNPAPASRYNLVVIGGGPAGLVVAAAAAGLGAKVALVEKHRLGGDCLNYGCVPSKALLRCAKAVADVRGAGEFGVHVGGGDAGNIHVDFPAMMQRLRTLRADLSKHDSAARFHELGIDVFLGAAEFTGRRTVAVAGKTLNFAKCCIATGARPVIPKIAGMADVGYLTNETIFSLTELPTRIMVIGGGPIGCELAQAFARFGSQVTLLQSSDRLLPRDDPNASAIIHAALQRDGVEVQTAAKVLEVRRVGADRVITFTQRDGVQQERTVDQMLISAGRAPNVQALGLEKAGVNFDERRGIHVNDRLRTTNPDIYAAGDVCSAHKFTHVADAMARIVVQNALFFGRASAAKLIVPRVTYTDPELAAVGMTEREAHDHNVPTDVIVVPFSSVDRAVLDGETAGFLKVIVKKGTDKIVGGTLVARHAGDMLSELTIAMTNRLGLGKLAKTIHPYPTQAEIIRKAADAYNRTRLTPRVKRWMEWLLSWRR